MMMKTLMTPKVQKNTRLNNRDLEFNNIDDELLQLLENDGMKDSAMASKRFDDLLMGKI